MRKKMKEDIFSYEGIREAIERKHLYEKALGHSVELVIPSAHGQGGFYRIIYEGTIRPEDLRPEVDMTPTPKLPAVINNGRIMERIIVQEKVPYTMSRHTYNGKRIRLYI